MQQPIRPQDIRRHNRLYGLAGRLIKGQIALDGVQLSARPSFIGRWRLRAAARLYRAVLAIHATNWPAMIFLGKVHQRLDRPKEALSCFMLALENAPGQPGAAREAAIVAASLGHYEQSIQLTQLAIAGRPDDGSLYSNLALSCLLAGRPGEAVEALRRATALEPGHQLTSRLLKYAEAVASGRLPCPTSEREIGGAVSGGRPG